MDPQFRGASPFRFVDYTDEEGRNATALWDSGSMHLQNAAYAAAAGVPFETLAKGIFYSEANPGGWDAASRVADMDLEGIDHQVVNPTLPGLRLAQVPDPNLAA